MSSSELSYAVLGAVIALLLSLILVPLVLELVEASMLRGWGGRLLKPSWIASQELWEDVWKRGGGGRYLGFFEQFILYAAFWTREGWPLMAAWLAFKVACQWESWKHSDGFIQKAREEAKRPNNHDAPADLLSIQRWVSMRYISFLVGTGANILIAISVATLAKVIMAIDTATPLPPVGSAPLHRTFPSPDEIVFYGLQAGLLVFVGLCVFLDVTARFRAGLGGISMKVTRSPESIGFFLSVFAIAVGLFAALLLSADLEWRYRAGWTLLDTLLIGYVCLVNNWIRNKLVGFLLWVARLESR